MSILNRRSGAALFLALACALSAAGVRPAHAASKKGEIDPNQPSYVDLPRVLLEYRKSSGFLKYQKQLQDRSTQFGEEMKFLADLPFITEAERKEAVSLKFKPNATAAEKARVEALVKKSEDTGKELSELSQKQKPTDADTKRLQALNTMRTDTLRSLAKEEASRREQLQKMDNDLTGQVQDELLKVVEKVAKDNKIGVVYDRRSVLVGGNDLTDEVIKKLPK
jgi:Skp family chaperone for outer membrane proteins